MTRIIVEDDDGVRMYEAEHFVFAGVVKSVDSEKLESVFEINVSPFENLTEDDVFVDLLDYLEDEYSNMINE